MPIYEYKCKSCEEIFEISRSLHEKEKEPECPRCGIRKTQRVFSVFGINSSGSSEAPAPSKSGFG